MIFVNFFIRAYTEDNMKEKNLYLLYQDIILEHNSNPRNFRTTFQPTHIANGNNAFCGDEIVIYLRLINDYIIDISFTGEGCAISRASASMMIQAVKGNLVKEFYNQLMGIGEMMNNYNYNKPKGKINDLISIKGVEGFPERIKCAMLPWRTMQSAIEN